MKKLVIIFVSIFFTFSCGTKESSSATQKKMDGWTSEVLDLRVESCVDNLFYNSYVPLSKPIEDVKKWCSCMIDKFSYVATPDQSSEILSTSAFVSFYQGCVKSTGVKIEALEGGYKLQSSLIFP